MPKRKPTEPDRNVIPDEIMAQLLAEPRRPPVKRARKGRWLRRKPRA